MKVLLSVHHRLDPDRGAPGVTLALGAALEHAGCQVDYLSYDDVFGPLEEEVVSHQLRFPWGAARSLARRSGDFDLVDASTGDAWVWAALGRPGGRRTALVTRAHGLEHVADVGTRRAARETGEALSWKYPLYHGGARLWEVRRSLRASEQCILLNSGDRDLARDRLGVPEQRLNVIANGIADGFHHQPAPVAVNGSLRLAFVGGWLTRKGKHSLVATAIELARLGMNFHLSVLGTIAPADEVLRDFPEEIRARVTVTPRFRNERLPELLVGHELFLFPSVSEGSSGALLEAMACGLVPVTTPVGAAPEVITRGGGVLAPSEQFAEVVTSLAADRRSLLEMRQRAQAEAGRYRWEGVAQRTLRVYERAVAARSTTSRKRAPTAGQL